MADSGTAGRRDRKEATIPGWLRVFGFILLTPLIGILFASFMLACAGMVPTVLVAIADRTGARLGDRSFVATVGMTNACGVLPSLAQLWAKGQTIPTAFSVMADPLFWFLAFGSAGVGWFIFLMMPPLIAAYYSSAGDARIRTLLNKQQGLVEMWGEEVKGDEEEDEEEGGEAKPERAG